MPTTKRNGEIQELTREEGRAFFNEASRDLLGIDGEEFIRRWQAGAYRGNEDPRVVHVAMLLPFAER